MCLCARFNIDRIVGGLEMEVIHVMFYIEVFVVALVPSVYLLKLQLCKKLQKESPND